MSGSQLSQLGQNTSFGVNSFVLGVQQALSLPIQTDLDLNGHSIKNSATLPQNTNIKNIPNVEWVQTYAQFSPGQLVPLNQINNTLPLNGTLNLSQNNQQTLVNDCIIQANNKQAVNSKTVYNVQQTLQNNINTVQSNIDNVAQDLADEITRAESAESSLQTEITGLQQQKLNQVPIPNGDVNMNQFSIANVAGIKQNGGQPYISFDTTPVEIKVYKPLIRQGFAPTVPTNQSAYLTYGDYLNLAPVTPISDFLPPSTISSGLRPIMIDPLTGTELIQSNKDVAFSEDLVNYALLTDLNAVQGNLQTQITNEVNARTTADTTLQNNINSLSTNLSNNYSTTTQMNSAISGAITTNNSNYVSNASLASQLTAYYDKNTSDSRYYLNTTTLNNITAPNGSLSLNSQKITNLADPVQNQDAVTLSYFQSHSGGSLPSTATLNYIAQTNQTSANIPINNYKLTGLNIGTQNGDSVEYSQLNTTNTNVTNLSNNLANNYSTTGQMNSAISTALVPYSTTSSNDLKYYWSSNPPPASAVSQIVNTGSNANYCRISCTNSNLIELFTQNQKIGQISSVVGQSPSNNLLLNSPARLQLTSDYGSISLSTSAVQQAYPTVNVHGVYIQGNQTNSANNCVSQLCITTGSNIGQNFTFSSNSFAGQYVSAILNQSGTGQVSQTIEISAGSTLYPQSSYDPTFICYSRSFAQSIGSQPFIFTDPVAYLSGTQSITNNAQLTNKYYVDQSFIPYSTTTQMNTAINNAITTNNSSYYTKTASDARYYLNTTVLNAIIAPTGSLSLNSQKIINLLDPTLIQDAVTLNYLQTNNYTKTQIDAFTLNKWQVPTTSLNLNLQKIINLSSNITSANDAINLDYLQTNYYTKTQANSNYYANTTTLSNIVAPNNNLSMNNLKITNLATPTVSTDACTKGYADSLSGGLPSNSTLNSISATNQTSGSVNMNSNKIINLATPTLSTDAVNKSYADSLIVPQSQIYTTTLTPSGNNTVNSITHNLATSLDNLVVTVYCQFIATTNGWTGGVDWLQTNSVDRYVTSVGGKSGYILGTNTTNVSNSFSIYFGDGFGFIRKDNGNYNSVDWTGILVKVLVTKNDGKYLVTSSTYSTSNLTVNSNIDMLSSYNLVNLLDPTSAQQPATKNYCDTNFVNVNTSSLANYYTKTQTTNLSLSQFANTATINVSGQKITGLGLATNSTDAVSKTQLDNFTPVSLYSADLSTNFNCNTNSITGLGCLKISANGLQDGNFAYTFNTNNSQVSTPTITACMLVNDQRVQSGTNTSRWSLVVQSTNQNTSPNTGSNGQALICYGISYIAQRTGAGQTTSTDLLFIEGNCKANQFIQWTPSRRDFKLNIEDYITNDNFLQLQPVTYNYNPDCEYVQQKSIGTDQKMYGFIYEDVQNLCPEGKFFLDENQLNLTQIKDEMLFTLWNENKQLKNRVQLLEQQIQQILDKLQ